MPWSTPTTIDRPMWLKSLDSDLGRPHSIRRSACADRLFPRVWLVVPEEKQSILRRRFELGA